MTQEDKQLLLKDLCARLPYHPRVKVVPDKGDIYDEWWTFATLPEIGQIQYTLYPYLRPMSSMTEEEMKEYNDTVWDLDKQDVILKAKEYQENYLGKYPNSIYENPWIPWYHHIDWLNAHHFDYRGLIEKGLALEAPDGMYLNN